MLRFLRAILWILDCMKVESPHYMPAIGIYWRIMQYVIFTSVLSAIPSPMQPTNLNYECMIIHISCNIHQSGFENFIANVLAAVYE